MASKDYRNRAKKKPKIKFWVYYNLLGRYLDAQIFYFSFPLLTYKLLILKMNFNHTCYAPSAHSSTVISSSYSITLFLDLISKVCMKMEEIVKNLKMVSIVFGQCSAF